MKAKAIYTVAEIVKEAGFDPEQVGKVRVRVAGIPVNDPNKVISIQANTSEVLVIVGQESKTIEVEENDTKIISESARESLDEAGKTLSEKAEAVVEAKKNVVKEDVKNVEEAENI